VERVSHADNKRAVRLGKKETRNVMNNINNNIGSNFFPEENKAEKETNNQSSIRIEIKLSKV
jgi:hypothetical protein